ncbi:MAG: MOFRL family protein, partial [Fimbriimonadales bacterium]
RRRGRCRRRIAGSRNIVVASADSDGTDGPTNRAGGIGDGSTVDRIRARNLDLPAELRRHNSLSVLERLGDAIQTGNTGTNVQDLRVLYVGDNRSPRVD